MKARLTAILVVLFAGGALADVASGQAPFYEGVSDSASLGAIVERRTARADEHLKRLLDVRGPRTIDNTLVPYDRMGMEIEGAARLANIVARLHPDEGMRTAAEALVQTLAEKSAALMLRPDIYLALRAINAGTADSATRRYLTRELRDFELAGVSKPEDVRARLIRLRTEVQGAQQEFNRNLLNGQRRIVASASEVEGLPADFIAARKADASGSITLTTDDVDVQVVLGFARNAALRRRHQIERLNVAAPGNVKVLERLLALRHEIATQLGFPTWAEYHARPRMAGDAKAIADFIDKVVAASAPAATREYAELIARKRQDLPGATGLELSDRTYYAELVRRERYSFDSRSVRPYFPYERVRDGVLEVSSRLFGIVFRPAPRLPTWHPSVESYEVLQDGVLIGRLYLDAHPRAQKANSGASVSSVRRGTKGVDVPEAVLTAGVPGGVPGDPGLMTHDQVRTIFHEFGHAIHALVGGQGRWHGTNGFSVEGDVVEAPSTMLEEWSWDAPTLATFARHYQTNEPIPAGLVKSMRQAGKDLFSQFDRTNLLAPAVARRFRDAILAPGGSKPAADLIVDFLGRPFRFDAYEKWLNGESDGSTP